jgi:hypothetical protein
MKVRGTKKKQINKWNSYFTNTLPGKMESKKSISLAGSGKKIS